MIAGKYNFPLVLVIHLRLTLISGVIDIPQQLPF
jgi:hypothetical protein